MKYKQYRAPLKPVKPSSQFIVMVKPVGRRCNLACGYCYYSHGDSNAGSQSRMSDAILERFIQQYIDASIGPEIHLVWHGGEPTLAGLDFFKRAVDIQKKYLPEGWAIWNNIQTNGVLLDVSWCEFIAKENFDVGLSIDGTEMNHDKYRRDHAGRPSYQDAAAAVRRLQAHGVQPDLLCTVTSDAAKEPLEIYRALRELNTGWIQFIPIVRQVNNAMENEIRLTPDSVGSAEYGDFLCAIFDEWALNDIGRLDIQLFAEAARVWVGGGAALCWMAPTCGRALIVEMDGSVYSCDHYVYPEYRIGDIDSGVLKALADLPFQLRFGDDKRERLNDVCKGKDGSAPCPHLSVCNGACPKDRFSPGKIDEPLNSCPGNYLCEGLKHFFSHAEPVTLRILDLARRDVTPNAIMEELRSAWSTFKN